MRYLILLIIPFFFACESTKEITEENTESNAESTNIEFYVGTVHIQKDNCLYVEAMIKESDKPIKLYPVNLDEKFEVEGIKIKFEYAINRMMIPENCIADVAARFYKVSRVR